MTFVCAPGTLTCHMLQLDHTLSHPLIVLYITVKDPGDLARRFNLVCIQDSASINCSSPLYRQI